MKTNIGRLISEEVLLVAEQISKRVEILPHQHLELGVREVAQSGSDAPSDLEIMHNDYFRTHSAINDIGTDKTLPYCFSWLSFAWFIFA